MCLCVHKCVYVCIFVLIIDMEKVIIKKKDRGGRG